MIHTQYVCLYITVRYLVQLKLLLLTVIFAAFTQS